MAATTSRPFVVVTGGGTGGHVYPALAVADELVRRGHPVDDVRFLGSARGMEAEMVPAAGYAIDLLPGRGLLRRVSGAAVLQNLRTARDTVVALARALSVLRRTRPAVVFGVGGYAAAPGVVAARVLGIPVVVHEQNAAPGVVNRLAVALGARAAVSIPGTRLRGAVCTGNPVRASIAAGGTVGGTTVGSDADDTDADRFRVGVFGGSLGAGRINDAVLDLAAVWSDRSDTAIRHVTGRRDYQRCMERRPQPPTGSLRYERVPYEDDMPGLYRWADVVVTRAGAVTVAELAVAGEPAVVVPLPGAPSDHQTANGRALADAGAAVLLPDDRCDGNRLATELDALRDPDRRAAMAAAARGLARPEAAALVADLVEAVARVR